MTDEQLDQLADRLAERVGQVQLPRLIDAATVADLLGVPKTWVLAEARANRIPHVRLGKYVRFDPNSIHTWWSTKEHA